MISTKRIQPAILSIAYRCNIQYIPRNTVCALLCFVVVIHWLIFPYPSGLLHWHWGNLTIAPVPAKQPWWIWMNASFEFIMNDCITTTKQSTTKPCAYFLGYTVGLLIVLPFDKSVLIMWPWFSCKSWHTLVAPVFQSAAAVQFLSQWFQSFYAWRSKLSNKLPWFSVNGILTNNSTQWMHQQVWLIVLY